MKTTAIALLALTLPQCWGPPPPPPYEPAATAAEQAGEVAYGGAGRLTWEEVGLLRYLAYPQDYAAIKGSVGLPARRNATGDIYIAPDGRELTIVYDGSQAVRLSE